MGANPKEFDVVQLARATDGLTGSEIENVFVDALFKAFEGGKEPTDLVIASVLTEFVPLSKLMGDQICAISASHEGRMKMTFSVAKQAGGQRFLKIRFIRAIPPLAKATADRLW